MKEQKNISNTAGRLAAKKVILLGGSAGIGLATAQAAAAEGAIVIIASSNPERIDAALKKLPANSDGRVVDLGSEESIKNFFATTGNFDHLVYTAGENLKIGKISDTDLESARQFFQIRYWGALTAVKYGSPLVNTGGSITLTSGIASTRPGIGWFLGTSICAAMEGFVRAMAVELAPIRVNGVAPGFVRTNLWDNIPEKERESLFESAANSLPVKRIGKPEDIAQAFLYLMKQEFSTGQNIIVDGGGVLV